MKRILYIIICFCILAACNERKEYREALTHAQSIMEGNPDSSLVILDTLDRHSNEFGRDFKMQYLLTMTYAQAKTGMIFETDSVTKMLVQHFDDNGCCREQTLAYYMHGCALYDTGQAPEALQAFYDAIDKADTTKKECIYILKGIYGQMSRIFHKQNLPQDEIWALKHYIEYVRKTSSEEDYIIAKGQMVRPYYIMGEKDSVLRIIFDKYQTFKKIGKNDKAVSSFGTAIHIFLERNQIQKARKAMEIFERESGLFDSKGNIKKGWEGYYFIKGKYELALKNIDSAEIYFRRAVLNGQRSEGYKGLLNVYRLKGEMDSVLLFSELYEAAQDSLHNKMQTDAIHQMSALYNYSRSQKEAETQRDNARRNRWWAIIIGIASFMLLAGLFLYYRNNAKKKKGKIATLEHELNVAKSTRTEIHKELLQLKARNYEGVITSKESKLAKLTETIKRLQAENEQLKEGYMVREMDNLEQFLHSDIANIFIKKATEKTENTVPTEAEWKMLTSQFSKDNPATYKTFGSGKSLSKLELRICLLLVLDIPEYVISIMTQSTASTISNLKARANEKLFGKKDARTLKVNLVHSLKAF